MTRLSLISCMIGSLVLMLSVAWEATAQSGTPIATDSRIKTFVYNENDVFSILTHYGYQSNIEFGKHETVQTVSVGDRVAWQVVPAGRRLFVKAMEEKAHTNMTVVTNKRAYQFDLRASGREPLHPSEELVYVVRFFYLDEQKVQHAAPAIYSDAPTVPPLAALPSAAYQPQASVQQAPVPPVTMMPEPTAAPQPQLSMNEMPLPSAPMPMQQPMAETAYNYNYTYTGSEKVAPTKIYDDGAVTYFTFPSWVQQSPQLMAVTEDGREFPLQSSVNERGEVVVSAIASQFIIRHGANAVTVYNEQLSL